ncbi:oligoribonuclease [Candidatus Saccharibacteria bacterium]|nr:oligoribonuclease [Candidatus Saccharibacteria bacterium]
MTKHATLLWVDLEMTGLDPAKDRILEVAAIATDWNFTEYASYEAIIHQPDTVLDNMEEFSHKQHGASGLTEACRASGTTEEQAEAALVAFVDAHFKSGERVILAGNSIHQDRRFIRQYWPTLDAKLHYRMLDVSAWKVVFEGKFRAAKYVKPEKHRALEDIRGSIEELQHYIAKVKQG